MLCRIDRPAIAVSLLYLQIEPLKAKVLRRDKAQGLRCPIFFSRTPDGGDAQKGWRVPRLQAFRTTEQENHKELDKKTRNKGVTPNKYAEKSGL